MARKIDISKVCTLVYENWKKAVKQSFVMRPVSYALYQTWKYINSIEASRSTPCEYQSERGCLLNECMYDDLDERENYPDCRREQKND